MKPLSIYGKGNPFNICGCLNIVPSIANLERYTIYTGKKY